ncbi:MAG: HAD hydrolase-like protein [Pseudomonadota bacterium]|nr:HAD hydrolase-like protein [Pseudomonadota bacterium]
MNFSLKNKTIFILDWDGTIFDSMSIKIKNFGKVFKDLYDLNINLSEQHYIKNSGLPRYFIFEKLLKNHNIKFSQESLGFISKKLSTLNKKFLINADVFEDSLALINYLIKTNRKVCISSSLPQEELTFFFKKKLSHDIQKQIRFVLGSTSSFQKGKNHVNFLKNKFLCSKAKFIMIGDDYMDMELAKNAKIDSLYINRNKKNNNLNFNTVSSLREVIKCLR